MSSRLVFSALVVCGCASAANERRVEPTPRAEASAAATEERALLDETSPPARCAHPLGLRSVRRVGNSPSPGNPDARAPVELTAGDWTLRAAQRPNPARKNVARGAYDWRIELRRGTERVHEFAIGSAVLGTPSFALDPTGGFAVAWEDRSPSALSHGGSGGDGSMTPADESYVARFDPDGGRLLVVALTPTALELPNRRRKIPPDLPEIEPHVSPIQIGWWSGAFRAVAHDAQGLKQWIVGRSGAPEAVEIVDPLGVEALLRVARDGRAAVAYRRQIHPYRSATSVALVELHGETRLGGTLPAAPGEEGVGTSLALVDAPNGWWLVDRRTAEWPRGDIRDVFGRELAPDRVHVRYVPESHLPMFEPNVQEVSVTRVEQLVTPLHARFADLDVVSADDERIGGRFHGATDGGLFSFDVVRGCHEPTLHPCSGRVVSRSAGQLGERPVKKGRLVVSNESTESLDLRLTLLDPTGAPVWSREVPHALSEFRPTRDEARIVAFRVWGGWVSYSLATGEELWSIPLKGFSSCTLETETGTVIGYHDHTEFHFATLEASGTVNPLFSIGGQWSRCALARFDGGLLVATSYDDRPGANQGTRVFGDVRARETPRTRIAAYALDGKLLGVPQTMPGGSPVAWIPPRSPSDGELRNHGVTFATGHFIERFAWHWTSKGRPEGEARRVTLPFATVPMDFADEGVPTWEAWRGDDRTCDE